MFTVTPCHNSAIKDATSNLPIPLGAAMVAFPDKRRATGTGYVRADVWQRVVRPAAIWRGGDITGEYPAGEPAWVHQVIIKCTVTPELRAVLLNCHNASSHEWYVTPQGITSPLMRNFKMHRILKEVAKVCNNGTYTVLAYREATGEMMNPVHGKWSPRNPLGKFIKGGASAPLMKAVKAEKAKFLNR